LIITHKSFQHINQLSLARFAARARRELRLRGVSILLTDDGEIRDLNRTFRKKDKPTDVLSFPAIAGAGDDFAGDIAISVEYAARSAQRFDLELQQELKILILHGLIHLSGHDHEIDNGEMARLESRLRRKLGLPAGLIARSEEGDGHSNARAKVAPMPRRRSTISSRASRGKTRRPKGSIR
jgi:probable rRNA maturation factor